jgi:hypothetical protein
MKTKLNSFLLLLLVCAVTFSCIHRKKKKGLPPGICCLSQGTLVRLANGKDILIENLKVGDTVLAFNKKTERFVPSRVQKTFQTEHAGFMKLNFLPLSRNGVEVFPAMSIILSQDHPVWIKDKGWCSTEPEMTKRILMMKDVKRIAVGDSFYTNKDGSKEGYAGNAVLGSIEKVKESVRAYTIVRLENDLDCFLANGIVVGTEPLSMQEGGD